jgi:hypothetical protein
MDKKSIEVIMKSSSEEILADIDHTLDQMIKNAVALQQIAECEALSADCASFHKLQHSLTGRMVHREELLQILGNENRQDQEQLRAEIREKLCLYKKLNNSLIDTMALRFTKMEPRTPVKKQPRIGHNRRRAPAYVAKGR